MTKRIVQPGRSPVMSWMSRVLMQYFTAASLRTISGAGSSTSRRTLRAYLAQASLVLIVFATGACSDSAPTQPPTTTPPASVAAVQVVPEAIQLAVGETQQLTAAPRDANGNALTRPVVWRSSNPALATVDANGVVRAIAGGTVTITAAAEGKEGNAAVVVQAALPIELELSKPTMLFTGIAAIMSPAAQTGNVTSKNGVADGLLTAIEYGTGDPTGWLVATLSGTAAPATITINATTGVLLPGSYTARVLVRSATKPEIITRAIDIMFVVQPGPQMDVSASDRHNCALDLNGQVFCWGYNGSRQLGVGSIANQERTPVLLPGGNRFMKLSTGELHACGITPDAKAYCWGNGYMGDDQGPAIGVAPREVAGNHSWDQIAAGYRHTCGLTNQGEAYCWGTNLGGQLGNGTRVNQTMPVKVSGGLTFVAISAGEEHTCALTAAGDAYCWGRTAYGRLGQTVNSTDASVTPLKVPGGMQWTTLEAGRLHSCGIVSNGEAYCWGYNGNGQLGDGSRTDRSSPTPLATSVRFTTISTGNAHSCAIATNGAGYCWGLRSPGAVGDGIKDGYALTPSQVAAGGTSFKRITAGNAHSCAVSTVNTVYCWGYNANGAVGDGTNTDRILPVWIRLE